MAILNEPFMAPMVPQYNGGVLSPEMQAAAQLDASLIRGNNPNYMMQYGQAGEDQIVKRPTGVSPVVEKASTANTGNARNSMLAYPDHKIGVNEMLMRTGGAVMGGAQQGGLQAYSDGLAQYGAIQDYNRAGDVSKYINEANAFKKLGLGEAGVKDPYAGRVVNDEIFRAIDFIGESDKGWIGATGMGSIFKYIPESDANALANMLQTIEANIGFDKLQAMREASPTGGALGQVSNQELKSLQSVFGSLDQSMTSEQLLYNLRRLRVEYNNVVHGPGNHPYTMDTSTDNAAGTYQGSGESENVLNARKIIGG